MRGAVRTLLALLLLSLPAVAQFTSVTGTVTDPNGVPYGNGTIAPILVNNSGQSVTLNGQPYAPPIQATGLDSTGKFSLNLPANANLSPAGTKWNFWVCSALGTVNPSIGTGSQCFTLASPLTIAGATQDISTQLQAVALPLTKSGGASSVPFSGVTAGANTKALQMGTGGGLSPVNLGQIAGSELWLPAGYGAATFSCANTGGSINSGQSIQAAYTLNSALGSNLVSDITTTSTGSQGCSGGATTFTINAPSLGAYSSWTAYYCNGSGSPSCTNPRQVSTCVNLSAGVNCTITSSANGTVALPTLNTAWLQPSNVQATPPGITLPPAAIVSGFQTKVDGNSYPLFGQDASACSPLTSPCGIFTFWDHVFINDTGTNFAGNGNNFGANNGIIKNNAFGVAHLVGAGTTAASGFDDRAVGIRTETNSNMAGANNPRVMGIYGETILNGSPTALSGGGPDAGAIGIRWTIGDDRNTTGGTLSGSPMVALDGSYQFTPSSGTNWGVASCNPCAMGVRGVASLNANNINGGGLVITGVYGQANGSAGGSNVQGTNFYSAAPSTAPQSGIIAYFAQQGFPTTSGNWFLRSDTSGLPSIIGGTLSVPSIATDAGTLGVTGSGSFTGALTTTQLAAPSTTPSCPITGTTTFTFLITARDSNGNGVTGLNVNFFNCASNITATNYLQFTNIVSTGASSYDVYFTNAGGGTCNGGGCTLGKIFTCTPIFSASNASPKCTFQYTGTAGDGTTAPPGNSTGGYGVAGDLIFTTGKGQHVDLQAANNDVGGTVSCSASTVTVPFTRAYANSPVIVVSDDTTSGGAHVSARSGSSFTITCTGATDQVDYMVLGNPN